MVLGRVRVEKFRDLARLGVIFGENVGWAGSMWECRVRE